MLETIFYLIGFGIYFWLDWRFANKGRNNHKNMSNSQIDNEIDKYLK